MRAVAQVHRIDLAEHAPPDFRTDPVRADQQISVEGLSAFELDPHAGRISRGREIEAPVGRKRHAPGAHERARARAG